MTKEVKPSPHDCAIDRWKGKTMDHEWLFRVNFKRLHLLSLPKDSRG